MDNRQKVIEQHNRDIYNQAYITALLVGQMLNGKNPSKFEDLFTTTQTEEAANNAVVKELFLDYAER